MRKYIVLKLVRLAQRLAHSDAVHDLLKSVRTRMVMDEIYVTGDWSTEL